MLIHSHYYFTLYINLLRVTDAKATKHCYDTSSGDTPNTDHDNEEHVNDDLPKSHSSTIAGKMLGPCVMVRLFTSNCPELSDLLIFKN